MLFLARPVVRRKVLRRQDARVVAAAVFPARTGPTRMPHTSDDFASFVHAECGDEIFAHTLVKDNELEMGGRRQREQMGETVASMLAHSTRTSGNERGTSAHVTSGELGDAALLMYDTRAVLAHASHALLNRVNCALWLPILQRLHHRGALTPQDYVHARRYVGAATHAALLPWLWSARSTSVAGTACSASVAPAQLLGENGTVVHGTESELLARLSTADPSQWSILAAGVAPSLTSDSLHRWHDFLFTLARSTAFSSGAGKLHEAHTTLLAVLDHFYRAIVTDESLRHRHDLLNKTIKDGPVTHQPPLLLLPPLFLLHCRRHYHRQHALQAFAKLVCFCVLYEERMLHALQAASSSSSSTVRSPWCTTVLLADHDVFDFFLSIPGRRENGLDWQTQWQLAQDYARFAFVRLYRQLHPAGSPSSSTPAWTCNTLTSNPISKAAQIFFNVCVWVRNNNEEGMRCVQGLRVLFESYEQGTNVAEQGRRVPWCVVSTLAHAALRCMRAKAQQLHYGPLRGLLQVQTCVAMLAEGRLLAPPTQPAGQRKEERNDCSSRSEDYVSLPTWLNVREGTSMRAIWHAMRHHCRARVIACYALTHLGFDLLCRLCAEAEAARVCRDGTGDEAAATVHRVRRQYTQLTEWAVEMCQPLCFTAVEVAEVWGGQLRARAAADTRSAEAAAAWLWSWGRLTDCAGPPESRARAVDEGATETWTGHKSNESGDNEDAVCERTEKRQAAQWICGCGARNAWRSSHTLTCVSCVVRSQVPFTWQCPTCHWIARAGEPLERCVRCGHDHPARTAATTQASRAVDAALVYHCTACGRYSSPVPDSSHGECAACGAVRQGYWLAAASWRCGCGAEHSVTQRHCPHCTYPTAASSVSAPQARDSTTHENNRGDGERHMPRYTCPHCATLVYLSDDAAHVAGEAVCGRCPGCTSPHPRVVALRTRTRLCICPQCHYYTAARGTQCSHCHSPMLSLVQDLLPTYADRPWCCHACGLANPVRDECGRLLPACPDVTRAYTGARCGLSSGASSTGERRCGRCHTVPPAFAPCAEGMEGEEGDCPSWHCSACGAQGNQAYSCDKCHALHPLLVGRPEVHLWGCAVCRTTLNASWQCRCRLPGCPGLHEEAASIVCYSPYYCTQCGYVSRSVHWLMCEHCGYRPGDGQTQSGEEDARAAPYTAMDGVDCDACRRARALDLSGAASERPHTSPSHASAAECHPVTHPAPSLTMATAMSAAVTLSHEARLRDVEACLLQASQDAAQQHAPKCGHKNCDDDGKWQSSLGAVGVTQQKCDTESHILGQRPASPPLAPPPPLLPGESASCITHATHL